MLITLQQKDANYIAATGSRTEHYAVHRALAYMEDAQVYDPDKRELVIRPVERSLFESRWNRFPVGLISFVNQALMQEGHQVHFTPLLSNRFTTNPNYQLPGVTYEPYQDKLLKHIGFFKRGIMVGPTGMGKTIIIGGVIQKLNVPKTLIIVINKVIFHQVVNNMVRWFPNTSIGRIGDGSCTLGWITVALFQSLDKVTLRKSDNVQLFIMDEAHRINSTIMSFLKESGKLIFYRYGLTATPWDISKELKRAGEMQGFIGPIIREVSDDEAEARVIPAVVYLTKYQCTRPIGETYQESYRKDILLSPDRNKALLEAAYRLIISHGKICLILLDEVKQAKIMKDIATSMGLNPILATGENTGATNQQIQADLNNGKTKLVIATPVFGTGVDIPNVEGVVIASARKSYIDTLQKIGRGRRRTASKDILIVIDCIDRIVSSKRCHRHFYAHSIERMHIYEEKGWQIKRLLK